MNNMFAKKGVSSNQIIVMVVVALIAIFFISIFNASSSRGKFSKFKSDFKDYANALEQDAIQIRSTSIGNITNEQIYSSIANGTKAGQTTSIQANGKVDDLALNLSPSQIDGNNFYEIKDDTFITNVKSKKKFYDSNEKHYVSDNGEVFVLPGFPNEENGKKNWYINETKFYESDTPVTDINAIEISEPKITTDIGGNDIAKTNIKKDTKLYIHFTANVSDGKASILPAVPFEITDNGTYQFTISTNGRLVNKSIVVSNYKASNQGNTLKVGDYVDYKPDGNTYKTEKSVTGYASQTLITDSKDWRIIYIDKDTGNILITPTGSVNDVTLTGTTGYGKGVTDFDNICKQLYSNSKLGLVARCMNIEDANKIMNQSVPAEPIRYAFYPRGTSVSGTMEYEGNTYTKSTNEWRVARFYTCDGGGVEKTDNAGIQYNEPEEDNPVFVTQTFYTYKANSTSSEIGKILGSSTAWLASQCTYLSKSGAGFGVRTISSSGVNAEILYDSYANITTKDYGIHPVVEINYDTHSIDTSDSSRNGSTAAKAWKIIKDE